MSSVAVSSNVLSSASTFSKRSSTRILSSPSASKTSSREKRKKNYADHTKKMLRKVWLLLGISEIVLIALVITQILTLQSFIYTQLEDIALEQLQMLDLNYRIKLDQMVNQLHHFTDFEGIWVWIHRRIGMYTSSTR